MNGAIDVARRRLDEDLWVAEHPHRFWGFEVGRRMTVVRMPDGGLWLHSVARLTPEVRTWLDDLGPVRHVVSPSRWHHLWMEEYVVAFPEADLWSSPGLPRKRPDLPFAGPLSDRPEAAWSDVIDQTVFRGNRLAEEIEFLHRPSRTLILTDLCLHVGPGWPLLTRFVAWALGVHGRLGVTRDFRWATRDPAASRAAAERILAWDFDRVIVAHGDIVETDGAPALRRALDWLVS